MEVNGRFYPMWGQFVEKKAQWIGGILVDEEQLANGAQTEIVDITLEPNGPDSAKFCVKGKDFECAFDVRMGGVGPSNHGKEWLSFGWTYGKFRIKGV